MNRLQYETSPYLLQHAHNPVDWYAWKPEVFERAIAEQKPILVSIGYSTCHWCHVMERESFENADIAAIMNEHFINIKVDREERPDVDAIYMEACQLLTGSGGWPLNCFLTPDAKPFYAGTYFPPRPAFNRPSWLQLLQHIVQIWDTQRAVATEQADRLLARIRHNDDVFLSATALQGQELAPSPWQGWGKGAFARMCEQFDHAEGGFGGAPKFPSTMALHFLLHWHRLSGDTTALQHALFSLDKMVRGGIYDQIGGGFARYATDRAWLVPHFEKMLYDNALLIGLLSDAHKITGLYTQTIEQTLRYVAQEMTSPEGAFFAAQDADSEGQEGKFYVWDKSEIVATLGDDAEAFCQFYGVTQQGNWEGKNILWQPQSLQSFADNYGVKAQELEQRFKQSADKLLETRSKRVPPGLDDKVLLGWNALMASAHISAYLALGQEAYLQIAERNLLFLRNTLKGEGSSGNSLYRHSMSQPFAFLDDYACLIAAWTDLYEATFNPSCLTEAAECTEYVLGHFYDPNSGMFYFTDKLQDDILFRKKDLYDNATPSGNSVMAHNLQRLALLLGRMEWREIAQRMLGAMRETVERYPLSFGRWAVALLNEAYPMCEIAVVGENAVEKARQIQRRYIPNKVIAASQIPDNKVPLLADKSATSDALIYVCRDFACQKPVRTVEECWDLLNSA